MYYGVIPLTAGALANSVSWWNLKCQSSLKTTFVSLWAIIVSSAALQGSKPTITWLALSLASSTSLYSLILCSLSSFRFAPYK
ncbi:hypothetical protein CW304_29445 [Bacillus sp. UFRGS-B20]|nr:hypothetical protein CW304_29445 [Bacillus sp. UFRGS-B20]